MPQIKLNIVLLFVLVFLLAYVLGISIINLINNRLQNISIKMPKVEVAPPQVTVNLAEHEDPETCGIRMLPRTHLQASTEINQKGAGHLLGVKETQNCSPLPKVPTVPTIVPDTLKCKSKTSPSPSRDVLTARQGCTQGSTEQSPKQQISGHPQVQAKDCQPGRCSSDWQCNQVYGRGANRCQDGKCQCRYGTGFYCHLQPTYYLDPKLMTPEQVVKFKNKARVERMTLQDYKNWLALFESDLQSLPLIHRKNFWRLKRGDPIKFVPVCVGDSLHMGDSQHMGDSPATSQKCPVNDSEDAQETPTAPVQTGAGCDPIMPRDERMYRTWGSRQLGPAGINPESQNLIEVKLKIPAVEADTAHNYMFTDDHMDTSGYVRNVNVLTQPLEWSNYSNAFEPNKKYQEYQDNKMKRFKTTPVASWFQNSAIELSDLVESTYFDPKFNCNQ